MHIHQAVYVRISNSIFYNIFVCISCSISGRIFASISNSISCCIFRAHSQPSRCRHGCFAFAGAGARSLQPSPRGPYGKFVARQRKYRQTAIQSDQVCATEQRHPAATCTGAPWLRAEVPWQSWLAVDHDVTAEQRCPSDVEMLSSFSNRQPLPRKRSFLEVTSHRNPSTEKQRIWLQRY